MNTRMSAIDILRKFITGTIQDRLYPRYKVRFGGLNRATRRAMIAKGHLKPYTVSMRTQDAGWWNRCHRVNRAAA